MVAIKYNLNRTEVSLEDGEEFDGDINANVDIRTKKIKSNYC